MESVKNVEGSVSIACAREIQNNLVGWAEIVVNVANSASIVTVKDSPNRCTGTRENAKDAGKIVSSAVAKIDSLLIVIFKNA
jgi:hypothetical protein